MNEWRRDERGGAARNNYPSPDQLFKAGSQNHTIYSRLLQGPITNGDMIFGLRIGKYTGRISEIRKRIRPYLLDIKAVRNPQYRSLFVYSLAG